MKRKLAVNLLCLVLLLILISSTTVTLAAWAVRSDTVNTVSVGTVRAIIEEEYKQGQEVVPEVAVDKVVRVTNTGELDCLVRIQTELVWLDGYDASGEPIINGTLATDNIEIMLNDTYWYEWDGYYYYKGVLAPGATTEPLMEQFYVTGDTGSEYSGKEANLIVRMECIQAGETELSLWGLDYQTLGIVYERVQLVDEVMRVILKGPEGFEFPDNGGDLFANFKSLAPGESRTQKIEVSNIWEGDPTQISFFAEVAAQPSATADTEALIEKLLKEHIHITVSDDSNQILYEGPVWGNLNASVQNNGTMRYAIPLGSFSTGDSKTLTVSLSANSQMGNEYAGLLGNVTWVFQAQGDEKDGGGGDPGGDGNSGNGNGGGISTEYPNNPKTGDRAFLIGAGITAVSAVSLAIAVTARKKKKA